MDRPWRLVTACAAWLGLAAPVWAQTPAPPVTVAAAKRGDVPLFASGVGNVRANLSVLIRARVDGQIDKIEFTEGQDVKPGDAITEIDPRPYQAILAQAQAKRAADQAQLENAQLDEKRYAALARTNFASQQQLDTQQALVRQTQASLIGDDAAIQAAALNLSFCYITSPIRGVVGLRLVDVGNLVHATDSTGIVTITQVEPIAVYFTLPESEFPKVRDAMNAAGRNGEVRVLAFAEGGGRELSEGSLLAPDNSIDTTTGTITLKAMFANRNRALWPGQFIDAHIQLGVAHDAVTVPTDAVQHAPDALYVYIVKPDHTAVRQDVKTGYAGEGQTVITDGLQGGEQVIVSGQLRVTSGNKVDPRPQTAG